VIYRVDAPQKIYALRSDRRRQQVPVKERRVRKLSGTGRRDVRKREVDADELTLAARRLSQPLQRFTRSASGVEYPHARHEGQARDRLA
jgi:hypothetical protein